MKTTKLIAVGLAFALAGTAAQAQSFGKMSRTLSQATKSALITHGTTGTGVTLAVKPKNANVVYRADFNSLNMDQKITKGANDFTAKLDMQTYGLMVDMHPYRNALKLTAGLVFVDESNSVNARSRSGGFNFNGNVYAAGPNDSTSARIDFPSIMPYVGVGLSNMNEKEKGGLTYFVDLGVMYGNPKGELQVSPGLAAAVDAGDLAAERARFREDLNDYKFLPVLKGGVGIRF